MSSHSCPLCPETHDDQTDLRVHLEVQHRKSELASHLVGSLEGVSESTIDGEVVEEEQPAPSI